MSTSTAQEPSKCLVLTDNDFGDQFELFRGLTVCPEYRSRLGRLLMDFTYTQNLSSILEASRSPITTLGGQLRDRTDAVSGRSVLSIER